MKKQHGNQIFIKGSDELRLKRGFICTLIVLLIFSVMPSVIFATSKDQEGKYKVKDEVIYANLFANGKVKDMYVVNQFDVTRAGKIIDYGSYTNVRNLTDLTEIDQHQSGEVQFEAEEGKFFYQGELENTPLPWDISITYVLDGEKIEAEDLPGRSGKLEINIETAANEDVDELFFEHFLLQVSVTIDPTVFQDMQAPKGTEANEGENKQITFTVLPEQEEVLILSANVTNFEMDPIDIAAIPANIAIEDPDLSEMTGEMGKLSKAIADVHEGVGSLNDGAADLSQGVVDLNEGSTTYRNGIIELDQSSASLIDGSKEIQGALEEVSKAMQASPDIEVPDLSELEEIPVTFRDLAKEIRAFSTEIGDLDDLLDSIPDEIDQDQMDTVYDILRENAVDEEVLKQLDDAYEVALKIKDSNIDIPTEVIGMIDVMAEYMEELADQIEEALQAVDLDGLDQLEELEIGLTTLASEYKTFHNEIGRAHV